MILKSHKSHVRFISGLFFLAAALLIATGAALLNRIQSSEGVGTARKGFVSEKTLLKNDTIHYPVFHDAKLDALVEVYVKQQVQAFEKATENKKSIRNHLAVDYEIQHYGSQTVALSFISVESVAGQPDKLHRKSLLLDLSEKRELTGADILQQIPLARQNLAYLLHDFFQQQPSLNLTPAQLTALLELQLADSKTVTLSANEVIFHINPYNPKSEEGKATIAVSKSLLKDIVNDCYLLPDPDRQVVSMQSAQFRIAIQPPRGDAVNPAGKLIALTFDDGPGDLTPQILDTLETYQSHATFFVLGHLVSTYASTLQRTIREGNEIGNHSWNHPNLRLFSPAGLDSQILATQNAIQAATGGYTPTLMRPPYGFTSPVVRQYLADHHLTEALCNADTNDWKDRDTQVIYDRIMSDARDGRIILVHDIHPTSVQAVIRAIRDLKVQGYQLVTLSQLNKYRLY